MDTEGSGSTTGEVQRWCRSGIFAPTSVIGLKPESDRIRALRHKMREYLKQGALLSWIIDPAIKMLEMYRAGGEVISQVGADKIEGEGPVAGFVLDLTYVWDPLAD